MNGSCLLHLLILAVNISETVQLDSYSDAAVTCIQVLLIKAGSF